MALRVPPEIFGTIIDVLHDDKPTLAACTLVSSAWLPRSRFNLFRSLTYQAKPDGSGFIPFLDFLQSSPELASLIHNLNLGGLTKMARIPGKPRPSCYKHEVLSYSTLLDILDSLPALSDFELCHVGFPQPADWTGEEHGRFEMGAKRELALHRLTLRSIGHLKGGRPITRTSLTEFNGVLSIFSSVRELRVSDFSDLRLNPDDSQAGIGLRSPLHGQTHPLSLVARENIHTDDFWDVINHLSVPVSSISISGEDFKRVKELMDFGTKLKHLRLDFTYTFGLSCLTELDLSSCAALTNFTLWATAATRSSISLTKIISFLRNLPLGIKSLEIYICCEHGCDLGFLEIEEPLEWEEIRSWLSRLSNLTNLSFVAQHSEQHISNPKNVDHKLFDAWLRTEIEQELSLLHKQGILSISSSVVVEFGSQD